MNTIKKLGVVTLIIFLMLSMYYIGAASVEKTVIQVENTTEESVQETTVVKDNAIQTENDIESVPTDAIRDLFLQFDYSDKVTYVIGHQFPDSDTVFSSIAMAKLLNELGIKAEPRIVGKTNGATNYMLKTLSISQPQILENAEGCQLWLVDHSTYSQMVEGGKDARIVGIVDHHGLGNIETQEQIFVSSAQSGSTASQVWKFFKDCGVEIDKQTGAILWCGIVDDTKGFTSNFTKLDEEAATDVLEISEISDPDALYKASIEAKRAYLGMSDEEIFYSDFKWYDSDNCVYGISNASVVKLDLLEDMNNRMNDVLGSIALSSNNAVIISCVYTDDYSHGIITVRSIEPDISKGLIENVLSKLEGVTAVDDYSVRTEPSISRKKFTQSIADYLNSLPETSFGITGS